MPKWSQFLEEDYEDDFKPFEKFKPRNKPQRVDEDKNPPRREPNQDKK